MLISRKGRRKRKRRRRRRKRRRCAAIGCYWPLLLAALGGGAGSKAKEQMKEKTQCMKPLPPEVRTLGYKASVTNKPGFQNCVTLLLMKDDKNKMLTLTKRAEGELKIRRTKQN